MTLGRVTLPAFELVMHVDSTYYVSAKNKQRKGVSVWLTSENLPCTIFHSRDLKWFLKPKGTSIKMKMVLSLKERKKGRSIPNIWLIPVPTFINKTARSLIRAQTCVLWLAGVR